MTDLKDNFTKEKLAEAFTELSQRARYVNGDDFYPALISGLVVSGFILLIIFCAVGGRILG